MAHSMLGGVPEPMKVQLKDPAKPAGQNLVTAEILPLDPEKHLPAVLAWQTSLLAAGEPDATWDWKDLVEEARRNASVGRGAFETYALLHGDEVQAIMMIETIAHRGRDGNAALVYVEYVATAPWNRRREQVAPRFTGCGSAIMMMAVKRSRELGYGGRLGLHSLPEARGFYGKSGMKDYGADPAEEGYHYFEGALGP